MDLHEIKKRLTAKSDRVKCVDTHPHEPWVVASLYCGQVTLWNHETGVCIKTFDIVDLPIRAVKFIARENWFICGADDMRCRVYNYNNMEKVHQFDAHQDYVRTIAIHPQLTYVLTGSDDMTVKLWDWSKNWTMVRLFEAHSHYVMYVAFNPVDPMTFATASLDRTVKVWNVSSGTPKITLEHEKGVNCVHYYPRADKPYLVAGCDDRLVKVWDYQTKVCVQTLTNHCHNVSTVHFHADLPLLLTGSEDDSFHLYDVSTFRLEKTLSYGLGRVWHVDAKAGNNIVAIAMDRGLMVIGVGKEDPCYTMDQNGKIILAVNRDIQRVDVRRSNEGGEVIPPTDGERLPVQVKEIAVMETIPYALEYNNTGQFICVLANGEYSINSSLTWRPKTYGPALSFAWAPESGQYAVLEDASTLKTFRNFKPKDTFRLPEKAAAILSASCGLLCVKFGTAIRFYDWDTLTLIRTIALPSEVHNVYWNEAGTRIAIATETATYILEYKRAEVAELLERRGVEKTIDPTDGILTAFEVLEELEESIRRAQWVGEALLYTTRSQRLCYYIAGNTYNLVVLDRTMHLLGYLVHENRVYLLDNERNIVSYSLSFALVEFKAHIARGNVEAAKALLPVLPTADIPRVGKFLEHQGHHALAMSITTDMDHKFALAMSLGCLEVAREIALSERKHDQWKQVGALALKLGDFDVAHEAFEESKDLASLLMLHSALGSRDGLKKVSALAEKSGQTNIAFIAAYATADRTRCLHLLQASKRAPEAAVFALAHGCAREEISRHVLTWKQDVQCVNKNLSESIADPQVYPNLFPPIPDQDVPVLVQGEDKEKEGAVRILTNDGNPLHTLSVPGLVTPSTDGITAHDAIRKTPTQYDLPQEAMLMYTPFHPNAPPGTPMTATTSHTQPPPSYPFLSSSQAATSQTPNPQDGAGCGETPKCVDAHHFDPHHAVTMSNTKVVQDLDDIFGDAREDC